MQHLLLDSRGFSSARNSCRLRATRIHCPAASTMAASRVGTVISTRKGPWLTQRETYPLLACVAAGVVSVLLACKRTNVASLPWRDTGCGAPSPRAYPRQHSHAGKAFGTLFSSSCTLPQSICLHTGLGWLEHWPAHAVQPGSPSVSHATVARGSHEASRR